MEDAVLGTEDPTSLVEIASLLDIAEEVAQGESLQTFSPSDEEFGMDGKCSCTSNWFDEKCIESPCNLCSLLLERIKWDGPWMLNVENYVNYRK